MLVLDHLSFFNSSSARMSFSRVQLCITYST
jgi:hypothetical protein